MKSIQPDLKSNNLSLNEAIDMAQNHPLCLVQYTRRGPCRNEQKEEEANIAVAACHRVICINGRTDWRCIAVQCIAANGSVVSSSSLAVLSLSPAVTTASESTVASRD